MYRNLPFYTPFILLLENSQTVRLLKGLLGNKETSMNNTQSASEVQPRPLTAQLESLCLNLTKSEADKRQIDVVFFNFESEDDHGLRQV